MLNALIHSAGQEKGWQVRRAAIEALGKFDLKDNHEAYNVLLQALRGDDHA